MIEPETDPVPGLVIDTVGGGVTTALETVTATPADVWLFWPSVSVATAVSVCEPFAVDVVSHAKV